MTMILKLLAAGSATALAAACALPLGAETGTKDSPATAPVICALTVTERLGQVHVDGTVEARTAVSGTYDLTLRQSGFGGRSDVRQGGAFDLAAGETASLGRASFSGSAAGLDGTLVVTVAGASFACPVIE